MSVYVSTVTVNIYNYYLCINHLVIWLDIPLISFFLAMTDWHVRNRFIIVLYYIYINLQLLQVYIVYRSHLWEAVALILLCLYQFIAF